MPLVVGIQIRRGFGPDVIEIRGRHVQGTYAGGVAYQGGLGGIHARTAAEPDDPVRLELLSYSSRLFYGLNRGVRLNLIEHLIFDIGLLQLRSYQVDQAKLNDVFIRYDKARLPRIVFRY